VKEGISAGGQGGEFQERKSSELSPKIPISGEGWLVVAI